MKIQNYHPKSVIIPENLALRRRSKKPLAADEVGKYDERTIYYDVAILENPRRLVALGPPPLNLKKIIRPAKILIDGQILKTGRLRIFRKFCAYVAILPKTVRPKKSYQVDFVCADFEQRMRIFPQNPNNQKARLALMAISKNNPPRWISDWCLWHKRLHRVERIYLYDNGSADLKNLESALAKITEEVEVVLVHWNFRYGPPNDARRQYAQDGALNHYREIFGRFDDWTLNLDIDEYLAAAEGIELSKLLHRHEKNGTAVVLFGSWILPSDPKQPEKIEKRSLRCYYFYEKKFFTTAMKYAFCPPKIALNKPHIAFPKNRLLEKLSPPPIFYDRIGLLIYQSLTKRLKPGASFFGKKVVRENNDTIYFYHFRGLNTNWKEKMQDEVFDPKRHSKDTKIAALVEKSGLDDKLKNDE